MSVTWSLLVSPSRKIEFFWPFFDLHENDFGRSRSACFLRPKTFFSCLCYRSMTKPRNVPFSGSSSLSSLREGGLKMEKFRKISKIFEKIFFAQNGSKSCFMMFLGLKRALKMFLRLKIGKFDKKVKNSEKIGFD